MLQWVMIRYSVLSVVKLDLIEDGAWSQLVRLSRVEPGSFGIAVLCMETLDKKSMWRCTLVHKQKDWDNLCVKGSNDDETLRD